MPYTIMVILLVLRASAASSVKKNPLNCVWRGKKRKTEVKKETHFIYILLLFSP